MIILVTHVKRDTFLLEQEKCLSNIKGPSC